MRHYRFILCLLLAVFALVAFQDSLAQFKGRTPPARQMPDRLDQNAGEALLETFRSGQGVGAFGYRFELEERPFREPSWRLSGRMYGYWFGDPYLTRIELDSKDGETAVWILRNGVEPGIWEWQGDSFSKLDPQRWNDPLVEGVSVSAFDLLMPYIHWREFDYLGPFRHLGRPVQRFVLENPDTESQPAAVEAFIDEAYYALLQVRSYDNEGNELRRWQAASFRRAGDEWILGRLDLSDRRARSSSQIRFTHYLEYPNLDTSEFSPETSLPVLQTPSGAWKPL